jgi:phosphoribosylcarboxyaminoimidazole (NCAIR) mutase
MANTENFPKVGIVMGSDSDMPVMAKAADILEELGIPYEMTVISAHREPDVFFEYAKSAEEKGFKVIIAGAGMAAHLPGMCAAIFPMPVIGIPMHTTSLGGRDSLSYLLIFSCLPDMLYSRSPAILHPWLLPVLLIWCCMLLTFREALRRK